MTVLGPRVLIVDDDRALRHFLRIALTAHGHNVFEAGTAAETLASFTSIRPDVVILDLGLPDRDGTEVTRALREWTQTPILVLSVRDQERDKVSALDAGADDYLTKPFGVDELLARLRVLLRRGVVAKPGTPFRSGGLEVDLTRRVVKLHGTAVLLTPTEYEVLKALVQAGGKVLTHSQLLHRVWGNGFTDDPHLLRVNISTLRQKLRDPSAPDLILTEPRVGYRLRVDEEGEA